MALIVFDIPDKSWFLRVHRAALNGDPDARRELVHLWDDHAERARAGELQCFLCDSTDCYPVYAQILPKRNDPNQIMAAPLCTNTASR